MFKGKIKKESFKNAQSKLHEYADRFDRKMRSKDVSPTVVLLIGMILGGIAFEVIGFLASLISGVIFVAGTAALLGYVSVKLMARKKRKDEKKVDDVVTEETSEEEEVTVDEEEI